VLLLREGRVGAGKGRKREGREGMERRGYPNGNSWIRPAHDFNNCD